MGAVSADIEIGQRTRGQWLLEEGLAQHRINDADCLAVDESLELLVRVVDPSIDDRYLHAWVAADSGIPGHRHPDALHVPLRPEELGQSRVAVPGWGIGARFAVQGFKGPAFPRCVLGVQALHDGGIALVGERQRDRSVLCHTL